MHQFINFDIFIFVHQNIKTVNSSMYFKPKIKSSGMQNSEETVQKEPQLNHKLMF